MKKFSFFPQPCAGCGKELHGATFLCFAAWCAECYARIGKDVIIAAATRVEARLDVIRAKIFAEEIATVTAPIISGSNEPDPDKRLVDWQKEVDDGSPDE